MQMRIVTLTLIACLGLATSGQAQTTRSTASAYALVGSTFEHVTTDSGEQATATSTVADANHTAPGGQAMTRAEFHSEFGRLRALQRVELDNQGTHTRGIGRGPLDFAGEGYMFGGLFTDTIHIMTTGAGTFRVYFQLHGVMDHVGPGVPTWSTKLYGGAFGTGLTMVRPPTNYFLTASGTGVGQFRLTDYYEYAVGATGELNLAGYLGALIDIARSASTSGVSVSRLDVMNTATFRIVPLTHGIGFTAASGTNYQAAIVTGSVVLDGLSGAPSGIPLTIELRAVGSTTPLQTVEVHLGPEGQFEFFTDLSGEYDLTFRGPTWLRNRVTAMIHGLTEGVDVFLHNGDVNGDNVVNVLDFLILRGAFGTSPGHPWFVSGADLNRDNAVNIQDFLILRSNFGRAGVA